MKRITTTPPTLSCLPGLRSRRAFLKSTAAGVAGLMLPCLVAGCTRADGPGDRYTGLPSSRYLGDVRIETNVVGEQVFTEGPAVDRAGHVFFTNIPVSKILKWNPNAKQLTVFRENSHQSNGLLFDPEGNLLACEGEAGRITRTNRQTGEITVLADEFDGLPLEAPNDLVLDAEGRLYFTSRPTPSVPRKGNVNAVYRLDPDGALHQMLREPDVHRPNGIVLSPDEETLYLIEADGGEGRNRNISAYDVLPDGAVTNHRVLVDFYPGRSGDGMCIDAEGNLDVAAGLHNLRGTSETLDTRPGIHVISPDGELLAFAETPEDTLTNCTFGGEDLRTLYVTCGSLLLSIPTAIPGKSAYRPNA
ncbi:MAG: SMP-30/gluconolactonase/LRE family protein [Rhodothermales bacterium]